MARKAGSDSVQGKHERPKWDELDGEEQANRLRQAVLALASTLKNQHDTTGIVALLE